jgi:hypothetical protein
MIFIFNMLLKWKIWNKPENVKEWVGGFNTKNTLYIKMMFALTGKASGLWSDKTLEEFYALMLYVCSPQNFTSS